MEDGYKIKAKFVRLVAHDIRVDVISNHLKDEKRAAKIYTSCEQKANNYEYFYAMLKAVLRSL